MGAVASNINNCVFTQNSAYSGWGGAFFGTDSLGPLYIKDTTFTKNNAYSRYEKYIDAVVFRLMFASTS